MGHFRLAAAGLLATAILLMGGVAITLATDHATVTSKTIDTTTGECEKDASANPVLVGGGECGAAVYGDAGFSGHIYGSGSGAIVDYICVHSSSGGSFVSYGGTYTFSVYDASHTLIGTTTETVVNGQACGSGNNAVTAGSVTVDFDANGGVVSYTVSIDGVTSSNAVTTFATYNSILNRVAAIGDGQQNSPSVAPPAPVADVPEAPLPALLVVTAGLGGFLFVARRRSRSI
jgi:hypothetical protein